MQLISQHPQHGVSLYLALSTALNDWRGIRTRLFSAVQFNASHRLRSISLLPLSLFFLNILFR